MKKILKLTILVLTITFVNKINAAEYIWPIDSKNANETYIEYGYGRRNYSSLDYDKKYNYAPYEGYYYKNESHFGVDITGTKGNTYNVISVVNGKVLTTSNDQTINPSINYIDRNQRKSSNDGGGYGNYIVIEEEITGRCFLYAHLKAGTITLKNNDKVTKGQVIGVMGSSGGAGHMHLHFEVRPNAEKVLPLYSLGGHANLVPTLIYGRETLDPTKYIGTKPETIEEQKNSIEEVIDEQTEPEIIDDSNEQENINNHYEPVEPYVPKIPATVSGIHHNENNGIVSVNIEFDKEIKVETVPTLEVKVGNETIKARFINSTLKSISYTFEYNEFDSTTHGEIFIKLVGGNIITLGNDSLKAITELQYNRIGYIKAYSIKNINISKQGDVNNDGKITAVDASLAQQLYVKIVSGKTLSNEEQEMFKRADMNNNGKLTSTDAALILKKYAELSSGTIVDELLLVCDFNNDNNVNIDDYEMLQNAINNNYQERFDINNDSSVDQNDVNIFKTVLEKYGKR